MRPIRSNWRPLGRTVRAGPWGDHARARWWSSRRARRKRHAGVGFPHQVVDTVGAGDTFMAGFLDGYVKLQLGIEGSLERGAAAASIVCSRRGAQPPTEAEVDDLIAEKA